MDMEVGIFMEVVIFCIAMSVGLSLEARFLVVDSKGRGGGFRNNW